MAYGYVSLSKKSFIFLADISRKNDVTDQRKASNKHRGRNWYQKEYVIQKNENVENNDVKIKCGFNIFP